MLRCAFGHCLCYFRKLRCKVSARAGLCRPGMKIIFGNGGFSAGCLVSTFSICILFEFMGPADAQNNNSVLCNFTLQANGTACNHTKKANLTSKLNSTLKSATAVPKKAEQTFVSPQIVQGVVQLTPPAGSLTTTEIAILIVLGVVVRTD